MKRLLSHLLCITACMIAVACTAEPTNQPSQTALASPSPTATPSPSPPTEKAANAQPLTLPVLDAFFADESFSGLLKTRLQLTDDQIAKLRELAHSETAKLNEASAGLAEGETATARTTAEEKVRSLIGDEKEQQLGALVRERWSGASEIAGEKTATDSTTPNTAAAFAANAPNASHTSAASAANRKLFMPTSSAVKTV